MVVLMLNEYTLVLNFPYIRIFSNYSTRALLTQTFQDTDNEPIIQSAAFCVLCDQRQAIRFRGIGFRIATFKLPKLVLFGFSSDPYAVKSLDPNAGYLKISEQYRHLHITSLTLGIHLYTN